MSVSAVTAIAEAIAQCSKTVGLWLASNERRKMSKAIDYGEKYILTNENSKLNNKLKGKRLSRYRKYFFKYNN